MFLRLSGNIFSYPRGAQAGRNLAEAFRAFPLVALSVLTKPRIFTKETILATSFALNVRLS
jgi:hypothetical protein